MTGFCLVGNSFAKLQQIQAFTAALTLPILTASTGYPCFVLMSPSSRYAIIGILALMQLLAPFLHAHVGGSAWGARFHLPGLEFLSRSTEVAALSCAGVGDQSALIISPALGLKTQQSLDLTDYPEQALLLINFVWQIAYPIPQSFGLEAPSAAPLTPLWFTFHPRAPPLHWANPLIPTGKMPNA